MQLANELFNFCQDINLKVWFILQINCSTTLCSWVDGLGRCKEGQMPRVPNNWLYQLWWKRAFGRWIWCRRQAICNQKISLGVTQIEVVKGKSWLSIPSPEIKYISSPLTIISGITLRNNRISREFNMAAITARSAIFGIFRGRAMTWCQNFDLL